MSNGEGGWRYGQVDHVAVRRGQRRGEVEKQSQRGGKLGKLMQIGHKRSRQRVWGKFPASSHATWLTRRRGFACELVLVAAALISLVLAAMSTHYHGIGSGGCETTHKRYDRSSGFWWIEHGRHSFTTGPDPQSNHRHPRQMGLILIRACFVSKMTE